MFVEWKCVRTSASSEPMKTFENDKKNKTSNIYLQY